MQLQNPFFSIIIPTYNRPQHLTQCLESLTHLDYPCECFEVIVVDDGSKMPLDHVVTPFRHQLNLTLLRQSNTGPATARNAGATLAHGKYLVFTDDDCKPTPNWLKNVSVCFATFPNVIIGGYTVNALTNNVYSTATHLLMDYLYQLSNIDSLQPNFFASNNFALRADSFSSIGGFDTTFPLAAGEDREFCDRWLHHGYKMVYAPEVRVHHTHELNLQRFWQQHFNYGRGAFRFRQVRARRNLEHVKVEHLSFYWNLIIYPLSKTLNLQAFLVSGLLLISQVANVLGFFWELNTSSQK